ncbi:hypothetical protein [Methanolacinia paynteri]|uniref:hypothetical protein n=1 Tax=Methanolacinia paynteri TaxID=230356 RepID=UPI00064FF9A7|nr:hypothetical protein [Methanolacinia paynteri]
MDIITGVFGGILDYLVNSLILTSIIFAAFSVLVYLILTRIKNEKFQLITGITLGFFLIALSAFAAGGFAGSALLVMGTAFVMVSPAVAFREYLNKKYLLPVVFLVALTYPMYFLTTQYMCDYYYPYLWIFGNFSGTLILSVSAVALLIFIQRYYENFKFDKRLLVLLLLLIPGIIWFGVSVAAASLSALILILLNELQKEGYKISDLRILEVMIFATFLVLLPWPFLTTLPCVLNIFPLWIIPVIATSLVSATIIYCLRSKISGKWIESSAFVLGFVISTIFVYFTEFFL